MKWTVWSALGGVAWLAGIVYAKGAQGAAYYAANDHHLLVGGTVGATGLAILLWTNMRSTV